MSRLTKGTFVSNLKTLTLPSSMMAGAIIEMFFHLLVAEQRQ